MIFTGTAQAQPAAPAEDIAHYQEITGLEWMQMSGGDRMDNVMAAMFLLSKNGVPINKAPDFYYDVLYQKIQRDPAQYALKITNILANCVYEKEPGSRNALDGLRGRPSQ